MSVNHERKYVPKSLFDEFHMADAEHTLSGTYGLQQDLNESLPLSLGDVYNQN